MLGGALVTLLRRRRAEGLYRVDVRDGDDGPWRLGGKAYSALTAPQAHDAADHFRRRGLRARIVAVQSE
jgi:hypothetical protein